HTKEDISLGFFKKFSTTFSKFIMPNFSKCCTLLIIREHLPFCYCCSNYILTQSWCSLIFYSYLSYKNFTLSIMLFFYLPVYEQVLRTYQLNGADSIQDSCI